jgi:hypothetical protein
MGTNYLCASSFCSSPASFDFASAAAASGAYDPSHPGLYSTPNQTTAKAQQHYTLTDQKPPQGPHYTPQGQHYTPAKQPPPQEQLYNPSTQTPSQGQYYTPGNQSTPPDQNYTPSNQTPTQGQQYASTIQTPPQGQHYAPTNQIPPQANYYMPADKTPPLGAHYAAVQKTMLPQAQQYRPASATYTAATYVSPSASAQDSNSLYGSIAYGATAQEGFGSATPEQTFVQQLQSLAQGGLPEVSCSPWFASACSFRFSFSFPLFVAVTPGFRWSGCLVWS